MHLLQKKGYIWVGCSLIIIVTFIVYQQLHSHSTNKSIDFSQSGISIQSESNSKQLKQDQTTSPPPAKQVIMVDIKGAVMRPGVYQFTINERVNDAIKKSGGLKDDADQKQINLAEKLVDEMVIYVPIKGEVAPPSQNISSGVTHDQKDEKVQINHATVTQMEALPGIGPSKAQAIIDYRNKSGPFKTVNDLLNVSGIGEKSLEKIKDQVIIN